MSQTIALIAHDGKKDDIIRFAKTHQEALAQFQLIATGTTGLRVAETTGLTVERMRSGPYGGDAQIATKVVAGEVAGVIHLPRRGLLMAGRNQLSEPLSRKIRFFAVRRKHS